MSLWSRFLRRRAETRGDEADSDDPPAPAPKTVVLPAEPFVFECQACGKVFEARRKKAVCPECESPDVSIMSE